MNLPNKFSYHFYPVGQGLFSTGAINGYDENKHRFLWVYDCGTSSSQSLVEHGIQHLKEFAAHRKRIDLLTLSHFDHDHISGVVGLLKEFKIGTLMLPYMPLAQRLILAFEEGGGDADELLTDFCLNPVAFLLRQDGPGIEQILFIPPSGNEGPPYPEDLPSPQDPGPEDKPTIYFDKDTPENTNDAESFQQAAQQKSSFVDFLKPGSRITFSGHLWEFIPYNDDPQERIPPGFIQQVDQLRADLLSATTNPARKASLQELKKTYDKHFGSGSEERNVISLLLYSGPISSSWEKYWLMEGVSQSWTQAWWWHRWPFFDIHTRVLPEPPEESIRPRCSILYSGDGYLDTNDKLQKLIRYLDKRRVLSIGVFQVMHHGAEANWHQGTAAAIAPLFSVFSSDPERKKWKHPHASVLRDFWRFGAVQVDKNTDFTAYGYADRKR